MWSLLLGGLHRVRVESVPPREGESPQMAAVVDVDAEDDAPQPEHAAAHERLISRTRELLESTPRDLGNAGSAERVERMMRQLGPARSADVVGSLVSHTPADRRAVLRTLDVGERIKLVIGQIDRLLALREGKHRAERRERALVPLKVPTPGAPRPIPVSREARAERAASSTRDPDSGDESDDLDAETDARAEAQALLRRVKAAAPPPEVLAAARREARRLARGGDGHPGAAASVAYLEALAEMPWDGARAQREAPSSLAQMRETLDSEHAGLDDIKARVIEHVAVSRLRGAGARPPVLLLSGPPGVGKTSLAASVAKALGRPFARISLGGVRDEADIRGHRRTYVGALPGRIAAALRRAGRADPLLLLDEVDKMGRDSRGDPAAALLEVLDPEQNGAFVDHYLGLPLDLSGVLFIATANRLQDVPAPLRDRMEVVELPGYTAREKLAIARDHLVPRALEAHGLTGEDVRFEDEALEAIVERYTREAGVRDLARKIAAVCRALAVRIVERREGAAGPGGGAAPPADEPEAGSGALGHNPTAASWRSWLPWRGGAAAGAAGAEDDDGAGAGDGRRREGSCGASAVLPSPLEAACAQLLERAETFGSDVRTLRHEPCAAALAPPAPFHAELGPGQWVARWHFAPVPSAHALEVSEAPEKGAWPRRGKLGTLIRVDASLLDEILKRPVHDGPDASERVASPGAAAGLVWTPVGGSVLYCECLAVGRGAPGRPGALTLTGQLGEVLEESARIALSWVRAHPPCTAGPADESPAARWDVHVHLPSGAVPKDGPSAGVTLATALLSLFSGVKVRSDVAMTGELTLRGLVMPVGGVKEKLLAAHAAGVRRVIIPSRNVRDATADLPADVLADLEIVGCSRMEEVIEAAFERPPDLCELPLAKL